MTTKAAIYHRLQGIFSAVFDEDELVLTPATTAADVQGWDSLSHVQLILAMSKDFGIRFTASEIGAMKTVADLVDLIDAKLPLATLNRSGPA